MRRTLPYAALITLLLVLLCVPVDGAAGKPRPSPTPVPVPSVASTPATQAHPLFPPLDEQGFLPEGEFVLAQEEEGLWLYADDTLRVEIVRRFDADLPLTWFEADIWTAPGELLRLTPASGSWDRLAYDTPDGIARTARAVFAISADYFQYRINRELRIGIVLRDGNIVSAKTLPRDTTRFPNLDTMAILPDGSLRVFYNDEHTAEEYLAMGAKDVLCFGPWLVRDGEINPNFGERVSSPQPRLALGMVEPGHYVCIMAEGRMSRTSVGTFLPTMAKLLRDKGCVEALNLDGGQTAVISFMGTRINRIGSYNDGKTTPRSAMEMLVVGTSEQVAPAGPSR